jgi:hypothetical protein
MISSEAVYWYEAAQRSQPLRASVPTPSMRRPVDVKAQIAMARLAEARGVVQLKN